MEFYNLVVADGNVAAQNPHCKCSRLVVIHYKCLTTEFALLAKDNLIPAMYILKCTWQLRVQIMIAQDAIPWMKTVMRIGNWCFIRSFLHLHVWQYEILLPRTFFHTLLIGFFIRVFRTFCWSSRKRRELHSWLFLFGFVHSPDSYFSPSILKMDTPKTSC